MPDRDREARNQRVRELQERIVNLQRNYSNFVDTRQGAAAPAGANPIARLVEQAVSLRQNPDGAVTRGELAQVLDDVATALMTLSRDVDAPTPQSTSESG